MQNKAINAGTWKTWVESHSVTEIQEANRARLRLKRDFKVTPFPLRLADERLPKRPASSAYSYFLKARRTAEPGAHPVLVSKELGDQWNALSAAEKKPYQDLAAAEWAKFQKDMEKLSI